LHGGWYVTRAQEKCEFSFHGDTLWEGSQNGEDSLDRKNQALKILTLS
jgi:hypothetical protein